LASRHSGKEKRLALGVYPAVTLKQARELTAEARKLLRAGDDPGAQRKAAKAKATHEAVNTLGAVTLDWLAHQASSRKAVTVASLWRNS
jgi:Arm DNA-binding domain